MGYSDSGIYPLDAISAKFKAAPIPQIEKSASACNELPGPKDGKTPMIYPDVIDAPAIILSKKLQIIWQNDLAITKIWLEVDLKPYLKPENDIFDLLLSQPFQSKIKNWRQWVAFFIQHALTMLSGEKLERFFSGKPDPQCEILSAILSDFLPNINPGVLSVPLRQVLHNDFPNVFHAISISCDSGRLFIFQPAFRESDQASGIKNNTALTLQTFVQTGTERQAKMPISVLVARLNKAETLYCEMMDREFSRLLSRLSEITKESIEQFQGVFSQNEPYMVVGYFLNATNKAVVIKKTIECALELRSRVGDLGREWKIQKGWLNDIELNIGIDFGFEHFSLIPTSLGENLVLLGKSLKAATYLSKIAQDGQIWTSKKVIDNMAGSQINALRFGIFRNDRAQQIFIPNCFSKIQDLHRSQEIAPPMENSFLGKPVTQIFDFIIQ